MKLKLASCILIRCSAAHWLRLIKPAKPKADAIFIHGNIYTGVGGTSSFGISPRAQAIAVRGDRIQAIGKDEEVPCS